MIANHYGKRCQINDISLETPKISNLSDFPKDYKKRKQTRNRKISCSEIQTEEDILKCDDGLLKMRDSSKMSNCLICRMNFWFFKN